MIGLIKGLLGDAIGIAIAILAVILFSFFDPFGWFNSGPKLQGTSLMVREVKEIGELISAEYYGEAITSWATANQETRLQIDSPAIVDIYDEIQISLEELFDKENEKKETDKEWNKGKVWRKHKRNLRSRFKGAPIYKHMVSHLGNGKEKDFVFNIFEGNELLESDITSISSLHLKNINEHSRKEWICNKKLNKRLSAF